MLLVSPLYTVIPKKFMKTAETALTKTDFQSLLNWFWKHASKKNTLKPLTHAQKSLFNTLKA